MRRSIFVAVIVLFTLITPTAFASSTDVDLTADDGTRLKATYTSPGQPGPGMLLIHQCNMDRSSWAGITEQLTAAGVHVLSMDLRGFGDSQGEGMGGTGGFQSFMQNSTADVDMAYQYLLEQSGVDGARTAIGGASCGAMLTAGLASRQSGVKALMLLSGPPSDAAIANIAASPGLAVFAAAASEDTITPGVADRLQAAVDGSAHPSSVAKIYAGGEHGLPMFGKNADLEPALIAWLTQELTAD
jgi:dienelactone hydrolase